LAHCWLSFDAHASATPGFGFLPLGFSPPKITLEAWDLPPPSRAAILAQWKWAI
jgi:hypothetical protein